ncbi:MAG: glycoside-pentoside-hexuronide (GPH):cation symporter [Clostridiales bacterium]|nr:glycoside-pentoside-hexuronide (GPH):cation symporter [Clostridiales bacterium]
MASKANTYTKKELNGYLTGMFGQNLIYNIVSTGLYFYFQNVICLPAMALGWIFTIARIWDAINDPMMGTIVDKTRTKWGKCRPYLIIFPGIIGVVTILCFINGNYAEATSAAQKTLIVAWAAVSYIAWGMCFTLCDIPLWGITSLMTEDEDDRSKILGLARIAAGIGGIGVFVVQIAQVVAGIFTGKGYSQAKASQYGFIITVIIITVIASVLFEFAGLSTKERVSQSEKHYTFAESFKIMFRNKPFRQILISGILRSPIQLLMLIAMTLITYYYANGDFMNILTKDEAGNVTGLNISILVNLLIIAATIFIGQFAAMGLTPALTKKTEKKTLYNIYSIGGAVPFAALFVLYKLSGGDLTSIGWVIATGVCFFLAGAAMGGINVLQSVMIADCVDYEEYTNGVRTDGVFFSGQSFITKLAGGIASILSSIVYSYVGYSDKNIAEMNEALTQGSDFITYNNGKFAMAMFFLISIPPAIGMVLSALPTLKYALTDKEHTRILNELVEKRASKKSNDTDENA